MMSAKPTIDFTKIEFPSDSVTLKHLRSRDWCLSDCARDLDIMYLREKEWAELGFARQLGDEEAMNSAEALIIAWNEDVDGPCDVALEIDNERERLAQSYVEFGIAIGVEQGRLLVEHLERAGAAQAIPSQVVRELDIPPRDCTRGM